MPYLNNVKFTCTQRVLHRHRNRGLSEPKVQKWKSHMADSDVQKPFLNVVAADTASFFLQRFPRPRKMAGNLERKCIPVPRFRLSTKPPWRVHNKVDNVR